MRIWTMGILCLALIGCEPIRTGDTALDNAIRNGSIGSRFNAGFHEYRPGELQVAIIYSRLLASAEEGADAAVRFTAKYAAERNIQVFYLTARETTALHVCSVRGGTTANCAPVPYVAALVTLGGDGREKLRAEMVRYSTAEVLSTPTSKLIGPPLMTTVVR